MATFTTTHPLTDVVRFYGVIASYILSVCTNVAAQKLAAEVRGTAVNPAWLYDVRAIDPERYPEVAAHRHELSEMSNEDVYLTGINVLLDAVETVAGASASVARSR